MQRLSLLLAEVRRCTVCIEHLPLGPRPVIQMSRSARILIAGQAPGRKVHDTGVPFNDASGDRLREWLGLDRDQFYDSNQIALVPMGFCYPGTGKSGDAAPRPECAATWRTRLLAQLPNVELTVVLGQYAIAYHLPGSGKNLTETVQRWRDRWPKVVPMPHPSPRNNIWLKRNGWFEDEVVPTVQKQIRMILNRKT